jgi:hypothetical protein
MMIARNRLFVIMAGALALAGCKSKGDIVVEEGIGITAVRTVCPAVGVPDFTGDITLFTAPGLRTASAIDLTANITNLKVQCNDVPGDTSAEVYSQATFDVFARRTDTSGPRTVTLPYFATVMRGGSAIISKRVGSVTLQFAPGQERAQATGTASTWINRAEATLPQDIRDQITRKRKTGDYDAAIDPLSKPEIKSAIARASFELLVGFQLTQEQLAYNATR